MPFWGVSLGLASSSRTFLGLEWKADELENGICELLDFLHGLFAVAQVVCGAADQHGPCECLTIPESHWQGRNSLSEARISRDALSSAMCMRVALAKTRTGNSRFDSWCAFFAMAFAAGSASIS